MTPLQCRLAFLLVDSPIRRGDLEMVLNVHYECAIRCLLDLPFCDSFPTLQCRLAFLLVRWLVIFFASVSLGHRSRLMP